MTESNKQEAKDGENDYFSDLPSGGDAADKLEMQFVNEIRQRTLTDRLGAFVVHETTVFYSKTSLWCLTSENSFRKMVVWLIEWR